MTRASSDRGEATAQVVILTPILILMVFLGVQTAIYFHAANVAAAAAAQGAAAGSRAGATPGDASAAATQTLSELGAVSPSVSSADSGGFVSVTVDVEVSRILPFFPEHVRRTAIEPVERFVRESDR